QFVYAVGTDQKARKVRVLTTGGHGDRIAVRPLDGLLEVGNLNTLKRYGMVLSDGGNIALTAESDLYTTTKWVDLGINSRVFDLTPGTDTVQASDFEVLDTGPRIGETYECERTEIPVGLFADGFESGDTTAWSSTQ
ncbi:MAG: hypothetical protein AAGM22_27780, partial [Acidobacteriota bacterium]